jgi:hypothetical protein
MRAILIVLLLTAGFVGAASAQAVSDRDRRATEQLCAQHRYWSNEAAERCIGQAYREGARARMW